MVGGEFELMCPMQYIMYKAYEVRKHIVHLNFIRGLTLLFHSSVAFASQGNVVDN